MSQPYKTLFIFDKPIQMHPSFQNLYTKIELQRQKTLDCVKDLTEENFNKSVNKKWSIAQILSHLVASEKLSILYVRKKIQGIKDVKDTGLIEEIKMLLLRMSQRLPGLKFKAPQGLDEHTANFNNFASLKNEWDIIRNDLRLLLDTIPSEYRNRMIYKHVRAGYLNMKHALQFFEEHIIHHMPQIKKLL